MLHVQGDLFDLFVSGRVHRLFGAPRPDRLHHRAADQGDRHSQSAGGVGSSGSPSPDQTVRSACPRRQHHRLAPRLLDHQELAPRIRLQDKLDGLDFCVVGRPGSCHRPAHGQLPVHPSGLG